MYSYMFMLLYIMIQMYIEMYTCTKTYVVCVVAEAHVLVDLLIYMYDVLQISRRL